MEELTSKRSLAARFQSGGRIAGGLAIRRPAEVVDEQGLYDKLEEVRQKYPNLEIRRSRGRRAIGVLLLRDSDVQANRNAIGLTRVGRALSRIIQAAPSLLDAPTITITGVTYNVDHHTGGAMVTAVPQQEDIDMLDTERRQITTALEEFAQPNIPVRWRPHPLDITFAYSPDEGDALHDTVAAVDAALPFDARLLRPSVIDNYVAYLEAHSNE